MRKGRRSSTAFREKRQRLSVRYWAGVGAAANAKGLPSALAMARHISYRNGPHRDRRPLEAERRRRVA